MKQSRVREDRVMKWVVCCVETGENDLCKARCSARSESYLHDEMISLLSVIDRFACNR